VTLLPALLRRPAALALVVLAPLALRAQDTTRFEAPPAVASDTAMRMVDPRTAAQNAQEEFERFRRLNLPSYRGRVPRGNCPEPVGMNWCYWYDEDSPGIPPEHPRVIEAREKLLALLDTLGTGNPGDNWISGQRVRYLIEAERPADALKVAQDCRSYGWWCDALAGLALQEMRRYADAEVAFQKVLAAMPPRERCSWNDLTPLLDDDTRRVYIRNGCGTPERQAFEDRIWWFSRTRYGMPGNDSRTEYYARLTYVEILRNAASAYARGFDEAEREMLVRFGWSRRFAQSGEQRVPPGADPSFRVNVVGMEATPAHRLIPPSEVLTSPASSDSTEWAVQLPPVVGRYHPAYASRLLMLEHQQALFRRGDTALVVLAYDVSHVKGIEGMRLDGALVLTPGTSPKGNATIRHDVPAKGTLTVRAPWGPLLMSAEIEAEPASTLVRARYGIRPPFALGARVSLSDLLFYAPYGTFPTSVEEVLPHALATQRVRASEPLGVYWEAYNTNPEGERMTISLVVAPETEEAGRMTRMSRALRLSREARPVSLTVEDMSARGVRTSVRAVQVDISTLKPGNYLVQLEIDVAGQYTIRADRRIVVIEP
jgi:hypothetical protein